MHKLRFFLKNMPFLARFFYNIYCFLVIIVDFLIISTIQNKNNREGVLLVKPDNIGDFIVWLDAAKEFRNLYKEEKITFLCKQEYAEIADKLGYFDCVIPVSINKFYFDFFYKIKILINIRKTYYKTVIQASTTRIFYTSESIVRVSGAEQIIGFDIDMLRSIFDILKWQKKISDKYYTTLIIEEKIELTELERNAEMIRHLGLKDFKCSMPKLPEDLLPENCLETETKKYYVLFPGASLNWKKWPIENFSEIARKIYEYTGWTGIICGGKSDHISGKTLMENTKDIPLLNMTGKTSVLELASIIKNATIIITNDTGAVHIAAAVSTPSVCILGGGHYYGENRGKFLPIPQYIQGNFKPICVFYKMDCFNCDWQCIHKFQMEDEPFPCIKNISTDAVWQEISLKLDQT